MYVYLMISNKIEARPTLFLEDQLNWVKLGVNSADPDKLLTKDIEMRLSTSLNTLLPYLKKKSIVGAPYIDVL